MIGVLPARAFTKAHADSQYPFVFQVGDEALGLEHERVNLDALTITVRGKGSRERTIAISVESPLRPTTSSDTRHLPP